MKIPVFRIAARCFWLAMLLMLIRQNIQTQQPTTRADNGPGFTILESAKALKAEEKYAEAFAKALEAARICPPNNEWGTWGNSFEEAYQCARRCDSLAFYQLLLTELSEASKLMPGQTGLPPKTQAVIWGRMGSVFHYLGDYDAAVPLYEKALPFGEAAADSSLLLRLYGNVANLIWEQGDDYRALTYQEKALALATAQRDTGIMAVITTNLGNVWRTIDPVKSIAIYEQALALSPNDSETLMLLSKAHLEGDHNLTKALENAQKSLRFAQRSAEKADAMHQLGRVYAEMKQSEQAISYFQQAIKEAEIGYGKTHPQCAKIHVHKGMAHLAKGEHQQALAAFNQTLDNLLPLFTPSDPEQNPTPAELTSGNLWILEALLGKAETFNRKYERQQQAGDLMQALATSELALSFQQNIKMSFSDEASKYALSSYYNTSCEAALRNAFQLFQLKKDPAYAARAFRLSEQTKAVVLAEALYKKELKQVVNVPTELLESEKKVQAQIAGFEKDLLETDDATEMAGLKDSLFILRRQAETQEQEITEKYPAYAEALFSYRADTSPETVQEALPEDAALLEYFIGDSALYTFLITKDTFWAQEQALTADFQQSIDALQKTVTNWKFVADSAAVADKLFLDHSRKLYQWLLEPALTITPAKRLFIVPDGELSLVPFELLLTKSYNGHWIDRDVPFLMKDRAVSYRFSARSQPMQRKRTPEEGWGGFGLEGDEGTLSAINSDKTYTGLRNFGPLPFAANEIKSVHSLLGGAFWLNQHATRENFLKNAERHGVLHLAMHGIVDERNALRSRLLFHQSIAGSDPFVYASDLYNLQLNAGLSVLSACQSGAGVWQKGEGVMSLSRAFAFAGCPSVVMSLWNISDQSTSELMTGFYRQLKQGVEKDKALQQAKLEYLNSVSPEYAKPIYWAAFVPIGEMEGLDAADLAERTPWWVYLAWFGLALLVGWGVWRWKRKSN